MQVHPLASLAELVRMNASMLKARRASFRWLLIAALGTLAATVLLPQTATASNPIPGPCQDGYVAPIPTAVAVTSVPIQVNSTSGDYFVLYVQIDDTAGGQVKTNSLPILVTLGEDGTTTLSDNLQSLSADRYRVEKYSVSQPGDLDGDCVDDLTELRNLGTYHPMNPGKVLEKSLGAVAIESREAFEALSYKGDTIRGLEDLQDLEYTKFSILNVMTDNPTVYFMNSNNIKLHQNFAARVGYPYGHGTGTLSNVHGDIVYHPNVVAPDGSLGVYRFSPSLIMQGLFLFKQAERVNEILAAAMPFLDDNLYYHPYTAAFLIHYNSEKAKYDASRVKVLLEEDILPDVDFIPLNQAEGYGRLRLMKEDERPSPWDVAIYTTLPNDLPRVAGTITTVPQTPLSHVNLRAIQNGLPNAFIRDALTEKVITSLIGSHVYYAVTANGYTIRKATKAEVEAHHDRLRPKNTQTLQRDLTVTGIKALADVSFNDWTAFGVKAANVAELTKLSLPAGTTPSGFAVPFYFYDEFMKANNLHTAVDEMLADPKFQSDYEKQEDELKKLRKKIKKADTPAWIITALQTMHGTYPEGTSLRYRSSTNNEDLPSFNGAGLYDSKTQDPDETVEDGIDKSIKGVWASLWNYRAFLERDFHRVDHKTVAMGVLVHPNYSDEPVNGVAVSYDPITFQDDMYYVNSQAGEDLVTNPEAYSQPEQLLLDSAGAATVLSRSNLVSSNQLLMTEAQMRQLRSNLKTIHDRFKTLYDVKDGEKYAIEIEFKITSANQLAIKQARPWIFAETLELTKPTVTIAFGSTRATEGANLELTATRSGGTMSAPLTIDLTWSETANMLTGEKPTSVTIPGNQTEKTVTVPTAADSEDEHDSVVTVSIADDSDYIAGEPGSASATVTDDDLTMIGVSADAATVTEGSSAAFTFTRSGSVLEQPLTVSIAVNETGSRLSGALPTEVVFAANRATAALSFPIVDDSVVGETSVVTVQIGAGSEYGIVGAGSARVTVEDDDLPGPTVYFATDYAVQEGQFEIVHLYTSHPEGVVSFAMDGPDAGEFTLYDIGRLLVFERKNYDPPGDANQDGIYEIDLTATDSGASSTTVRLRFTVTNGELIALAGQQWDQLSQDQRHQLLPTVESSLLRPTFASLEKNVKASVLWLARQQQLPSPGPTISISGGSGITEGGDATFTVTASPVPTADLTVDVTVTQTGDFGATPGSRQVIIPTSGSATLTVSTTDDSVHENVGFLTATVNRGNGYLVSWAAGAATVEVADDDIAPPPVDHAGGQH